MTEIDWTDVKDIEREHIVSEGQAYLDGQIRLATAADQRASSLAGAFTAASAALIAGLATLKGVTTIDNPYPLFVAGGISAVMFFISAALCVWSTFPVGMWLAGSEPKSWYSDIKNKKTYTDSLAEEAEIIQKHIVENRSIVKRNARLFKWGATIGVCSPLVGATIWLLTYSACPF